MPESRHRRRRGRNVQRGAGGAAALSMTRPRRRKTNIWYLIASVVIAVLVIGGIAFADIFVNILPRDATVGNAFEYVEGVGVKQELMPVGPSGLNEHVPDGQSVEYNTVPPTSGDHWNMQARCGFYEEGLPDERIVHNLEHGIIVVSYNLATPDEVKELRDAIESIPLSLSWGLTRYYDKLPAGTVAAATWGVLDTMQGVDRDRLAIFFETYAGNLGPEHIPCAAAISPMNR